MTTESRGEATIASDGGIVGTRRSYRTAATPLKRRQWCYGMGGDRDRLHPRDQSRAARRAGTPAARDASRTAAAGGTDARQRGVGRRPRRGAARDRPGGGASAVVRL